MPRPVARPQRRPPGHGVAARQQRAINAEREADPIKQRDWLTFGVVGAGPTGVELAGALGEIGLHTLVHDFRSIDPLAAQVIIVEAGPRILGAFLEDLQQQAEASLVRLGVKVRKNTPVIGIDEGGVTLAGGDRLEASTVLWAA